MSNPIFPILVAPGLPRAPPVLVDNRTDAASSTSSTNNSISSPFNDAHAIETASVEDQPQDGPDQEVIPSQMDHADVSADCIEPGQTSGPELSEKADYPAQRHVGQGVSGTGARDPEKAPDQPASSRTQQGFFKDLKRGFIAAYAPAKFEPELILPVGPSDTEKYGYLKTNRIPLYVLGVFSWLSLSAGQWLFILSDVVFVWFAVFAVFLQIYLGISYAICVVGKDWDFEKHKRLLQEHPLTLESAPTVDVYLPCCKEPIEILENTYKHIRALDWPAHRINIWVLDDGAMDAVKDLATRYGFNYMVREDRPRLKKAGNLRWAFSRTEGEFFAIFDADFCPRPDFLRELIPHHLANPKSAIVQSPQFFRVRPEQTWIEKGAGAVQELFYRLVQVNRNRWGASICVGSNAVYRRAALAEVGGTAEIGFSEDVHTGFNALHRGWTVEYVPLCLAMGICPDNPRAFFSQQMRWCMGSTTLLTNPEFWKSNLSLIQKVCYCSGMMYYSALSLSIFANPLPGILLLWVHPHLFKYYNLAFAIPSVLYGLITLRLWAKSAYGVNVQYIMVIQQYAYFTAIKDRLFGRGLAWVPSGDAKAHKNRKYRNMRIMAWTWLIMWESALIAGIVYQILRGLAWWNIIPILVLDSFNLFLAHRFLFCHA